MSRRRAISSGPWVSGGANPIFTPVQPFGLWLAVTIATEATPRWNCAKYAIGVMQSPRSRTVIPASTSPADSASSTSRE